MIAGKQFAMLGFRISSAILALAALGPAATVHVEFFEKRIRPLLAAKCYACHSARTLASGGLVLDSRAGWMKGGSRGQAIIPGQPEASILIQAVTHSDPALSMPPAAKLTEAELADLTAWIAGGAPDPRTDAAPRASGIDFAKGRQYWAFQPLPAAKPGARIDTFLLAALRSNGLVPAPPADKRTLLRRVTFDLTGLPPTRKELDEFLADRSPRAFEKVIDRLLASPHHGERWARHWLDLVRFAETTGHEFDTDRPDAWRYRDYIIRAFNDDLPYNRLVQEHIAGDIVSPRLAFSGMHYDSPLGTSFLALGEERNAADDVGEVRAEKIDNQIDVFSKTFLGLTVACARCHDHKFDPISNKDYYALYGILDSTQIAESGIDSPAHLREIASIHAKVEAIHRGIHPSADSPQPELARAGDSVVADFRKDNYTGWRAGGAAFGSAPRNGLADSFRGAAELTGTLVSSSFKVSKQYLHVRLSGHAPDNGRRRETAKVRFNLVAEGRPVVIAFDDDGKMAWKTSGLKRQFGESAYFEIIDRSRQGYIRVEQIILSDNREPPAGEPSGFPAEPAGLVARRNQIAASIPDSYFALIAQEEATPRNARIHIRGDHHNLGEEVPRGFLRVLQDDPAPYQHGSGRKALAEALTHTAAPLVARVMVNRVWKHHFGHGLVRTVDNFGSTGERPSHPELLDHLARRFIDNGWSIKALHREILLSRAYQMSSAAAAARQKDPDNRLLSHFHVRRLEAEAIRDSMLAVSGDLYPAVYGPGVVPHISPYQDGRGKPESGPLDGDRRRSIYIQVRRNFLTPMLLAFDYPLPATTAGRRGVSTVPSQPLILMNNEFVTRQAYHWAARVTAEHSNAGTRIEAMFLEAFARPPLPTEVAGVKQFLTERSWADLAHVLFNAKEFIFVR